MIIAAEYSFSGGDIIKKNYPRQLDELKEIISEIDASNCRGKVSEEITMSGRELFSPRELNEAFSMGFEARGWEKKRRVKCKYSNDHYLPGHEPSHKITRAYREMDFLKDKLGVEVQLGKYAFMVYNVCAKMTIFRNLNIINAGIEIVPVKSLADGMSTGVSFFEQIAWDLKTRGVADIDIPVLIYGIDAN